MIKCEELKKIKISIIIPVYNVEEYIEQCLKSVLDQTLQDIEIIIVNDGTKDNSMKKIERYLNDSRIKVINKENGGLSSARNTGLKAAQGEYISFIDSDDFVEKTMMKDLYTSINNKNYDIAFSKVIEYDNKNNILNKRVDKNEFTSFEKKGIYLIEEAGIEVWNKIYNRNFLLKNNLFFQEGIIHEDDLFTRKCFFLAKKVKYVDKYHYYYRVNRDGSIMNSIKTSLKEKRKHSYKVIIKELMELEQNYKENRFKSIYLKLIIFKYETLLNKIESEKIKEFEKELKKGWEHFSEIEKEILREQIKNLLKLRGMYNFSLFDNFYWKNKMITKKIFRRALVNKIKYNFLKKKYK